MAVNECFVSCNSSIAATSSDVSPTMSSSSYHQRELSDFAARLSSCNFTNESSIADEKSTRQEAKLLMSLSEIQPRLLTKDSEGNDPAMCSDESEQSSISDSSSQSSQLHRETFSFTCPSLSLEYNGYDSVQGNGDEIEGNEKSAIAKDRCLMHPTPPPPAILLSRPLSVDDPNAMRLSADAVARNMLQSYQKAIDWRILVWSNTLSSVLLRNEQQMLRKNPNDLRSLLQTKEAVLWSALKGLGNLIMVNTVKTTFVVGDPEQDQDDAMQEPMQKRRKRDSPLLFNENFIARFALTFKCELNLRTPAGSSQIFLDVPGMIEGTFRGAVVTAVTVDVDTNILAAMLEKSCRKIVRASAEALLDGAYQVPQAQEDEFQQQTAEEASRESDSGSDMKSPLFMMPTEEEKGTVALVTPQAVFSDSLADRRGSIRKTEALLPTIPDNLEETGSKSFPHRISPQPGSGFATSWNSSFLTPRPLGQQTSAFSPPLVSPGLNESTFSAGFSSPKLPLLATVAGKFRQECQN